jgi:hypothetical protein
MLLLKRRPFNERFNRGSQFPLLEVTGSIEEKRFVITIDSGEIVLPAQAVGSDAEGPFVWLEEARYEQRGVCLALSPQLQGDRVVGAQLSLGSERVSGASRSSFTVFFGAHGGVDGQALVRQASEHPPAIH